MNRIQLGDPFEPTPIAFHNRLEHTLRVLQQAQKFPNRSYRWVAVLMASLVLLYGTALALNHFGVLYFLTERIGMGNPVDANAVVQPTEQYCDSELLAASVQDAYWDGKTLSLTLNVAPKGNYALYTETDRGCDGEHFDQIWWKGEVKPYDEWRAGRPGLMLCLPELAINGQRVSPGWDWIQNEMGETMLLQGDANDLSHGATLTLSLVSVLEESNTSESATLSVKLPPMMKGAPRQ